MKFVHIADMHFDAPFTSLVTKNNFSESRRLDQRKIFKKIITYIKENDVKYLFIAGDLYENEYVKKSTIIYINDLFKEIPETKIFIAPGNHDPYIKNSYYANFNFVPNVHIFKGNFECKEMVDANIYGMGFTSFYCKDTNFGNLVKIENGKPNILVMHASLNGGIEENREYNPVLESKLETLEMNYTALGHIHKPYYNEKKNQNIVYSGSPMSFGFDELGKHGMIIGEIDKDKLNLEFIELDDLEFTVLKQDVENFNSKEDLIEYINEIQLEENKLYKIELIGNRNFEINTAEIIKHIENDRILKIKDLTKIGYDLNELQKENTLKGLFVRKILDKLENKEYTDTELEKAIEIGLNAMEK